MKKLCIRILIILPIAIISFLSCSTDIELDCSDELILSTGNVLELTDTSAKLSGTIESPNCDKHNEQGFTYSTEEDPKISDSLIQADGYYFSEEINTLVQNTTYYYRVYYTNQNNTYYGEQKTFTTKIGNSISNSGNINNITVNSATIISQIISNGGAEITSRGVCWNTDSQPTVSDSKTIDDKGLGHFTSNITSLLPGTTYYVRSYSINKAGVSYGEEKNFTTKTGIVIFTNNTIDEITAVSANINSGITDNGGAEVIMRGVCWSTQTEPNIDSNKTEDGTGKGSFTSNLTNLIPDTTYFIRSYAINIAGTTYGNQQTITSKNGVIIFQPNTTSQITSLSAVSNNIITDNGGAEIIKRGVCWSTQMEPTIDNDKTEDGTGKGSYYSSIIDLTPNTNYYIRSYAENITGITYGKQQSFRTTTKDGKLVTQNTLSDGDIIKITDFPYHLKKDLAMSFYSEFTDFTGSIIYGKGFNEYRGSYFKIDYNNVSYFYDDKLISETPHGITMKTFIKSSFYTDNNGIAHIIVQSKEDTFTTNFNFNYLQNFEPFLKTENQELTNIKLTCTSKEFKHDLWIFGDSYLGINNSRWPGQMKKFGFFNFLINGLAGQKSQNAYEDFERCLLYGTPKYLMWLLGMNDTDEVYLSNLNKVIEKCNNLNITLILGTIPTVPTRDKEALKTAIESSVYRYIDFHKAVGTNETGDWYNGHLSSDGVHPTETGAKSLATQVLIDFPEIMQYY